MAKNNITISGGNINAGIIHVGDHAHITSGDTRNAITKDQEEEFQKIFDLLSGEIQRSQQIAQKETLMASVEELRQEIKKSTPDKSILKTVSTALFENLKYVKDLAPIVEGLWHKIQPLFT